MALIVAILIALGVISSPDQVTENIIQDNQILIEQEIINPDEIDL